MDCARLHPADLIPLRPSERSNNLLCSGLDRPTDIRGPGVRPLVSPQGFGIYNLAMTYDAADGYILLLGATGVGPLNGTETWTFVGGNWTEQFPSVSPESCIGSVLAYDEVDGYVVYFAGGNVGGAANCSSAGETWTYRTGTWSQLSPTLSPAPRMAAAFTNDSADGYLLLFGGFSTSCGGACADTWTFVGGSWSELNLTTHPSNRSGAGMAYDPLDGYVVLFGGSSAAGTTSLGCTEQYQNGVFCMDRDTWEFHGGTWTQLSPVGSVPPEPYDDGMTWDSADHAVLYTVTDDNYSMETEIWWTFAGGNWTNPGNNSWYLPPPGPVNRFGEALAFDWADNYTLLFGGTGINWKWLADSWTYSGGSWTNITGPSPPPPPTFAVQFNETGLSPGAVWNVSFGGVYQSTTGVSMTFQAGNGTYDFAVAPPSGYIVAPSNGTIVVNGASVAVPLTFSPIGGTPVYPVTFQETGLANGTVWFVAIHGSNYPTSGPEVTVYVENGSWPFAVSAVTGYLATPSSGVVAVSGLSVTILITFTPTVASSTVTFEESGLPSGTNWTVTLGSQTVSGAGQVIVFGVLSGTYSYVAGGASGYVASPGSGTLHVSHDLTLVVTFTPIPPSVRYQLTLDETGLPTGTYWTVTVGGIPLSSTGRSVGILVANGSYPYLVGSVSGYTATPSNGTARISGANLTILVTFTAQSTGNPTVVPPLSTVATLLIGALVGIVVGVVVGVLLLAIFSRRPLGPPPPPGSPPTR